MIDLSYQQVKFSHNQLILYSLPDLNVSCKILQIHC